METRYLLLASKAILNELPVKLKFNSPPIISLTQLPNHIESPCLECWNEENDCIISISKCIADERQQWIIDIKPKQIDLNDRKVYFSILSKLYPKKCLTVVAGNGSEFIFKSENTYLQSFIRTFKGIVKYSSFLIYKFVNVFNKSVTDYYENIEIFVFKLTDCNDSNEQSFYFDTNHENLFYEINGKDINYNEL